MQTSDLPPVVLGGSLRPIRDDVHVEPIVLDRRFRVWSYGVGHLQLLLHSRADAAGSEHINVLFEGVRAVKLRSWYQPLILAPADDSVRSDILNFADVRNDIGIGPSV